MNDEETCSFTVAGGHTFGKSSRCMQQSLIKDQRPEGAKIQEQGLGWNQSYKSGQVQIQVTSGIEGAWTSNPIKWDHGLF